MKTIASKEAHSEITNILQQMYASISAFEITDRYLKENIKDKKVLEVLPQEFPFTYYNVNYSTFSTKKVEYENYIYENCLVNLIMCIENYSYEVLERMFLLAEDAFSVEEASTTFKELAMYLKDNSSDIAMSKILVERKLRNEKTIIMLKKISDYAKCGCYNKMETQIEKINQYSLIRNCIIHNQSRVSKDLYNLVQDKYGSLNCNIAVSHKMCVDLSQAFLDFVTEFDLHYSEKIVKDYDAIAMIKENYIVTGEESPKFYNRLLHEKLSSQVKPEIISKSISDLKKNIKDTLSEQVSTKANRIIKNGCV